MKMRAPAVPIITVDPYFSVWSPNERLNFAPTMHWTGKANPIIATVCVDGKEYSFLGYHRDLHKMKQVSLDIDAMSTTAVYANDEIELTAVYTSALLLDDLHVMTRPVSYMSVTYKSVDGKAHDVKLTVKCSEELCLDKAGQSPVVAESVDPCGCVKGIRMGNSEQKPLNRHGDDLRIDWGYFYLCGKGEGVEVTSYVSGKRTFVELSAPLTEGEARLVLFAYDDMESSIIYFNKTLKSYWNKDGMTIEQAICEAARDYYDVKAKADAFSKKLYDDAIASGGEKYAEMLLLAYRQVIAAHKLVLDENGEILFISKECFSNGCAATVDVSYPSIPMFLLYNPELVKGMMRPVYRYADSDEWKLEMKYDFAPHDVGRYPVLNGQVYGKKYDHETREYFGEPRMKYQMPVEECGNMLVMEANVALATGSADFAAEHIDLLKDWCKYLLKYGADPAEQLCTDDFAGHLEHNCNLSLKAIVGIKGMAILMDMLGRTDEAEYYTDEARKMAEIWHTTAKNPDGTTNLAFDRPYTYSMKYNMVWDKVWGTGIFTDEFMDNEVKDNFKHFNEYGMPLDNRTDYTKSDWTVWTASMASDKETFEKYIAPMWKAYDEMDTRTPMTDWYDTVSAKEVGFRNRTVQGGLYMKLLMDAWRK